MAQSNMVTGLFRDRDSAERAYQSITERGYEEGIKQGGILMGIKPRSSEDAQHFEKTSKDYQAEDVYR